MFRRYYVIPAAASALVAASAAILASATAADARAVFQGRDFAHHTQDGALMEVCDAERDGHAVWSRYNTLRDHTKPHPRVTIDYDDPDADKCGKLFLTTTKLYNFRVVEDKPNSSNNYLGPWHGYPVVNN